MTKVLQLTRWSGAAIVAILATPLLAFAQGADPATPTPAGGAEGLQSTVTTLTNLVNSVIPLLLAVAVVLFLWGLVQYIFHIGGDEGTKKGTKMMIWGVVAIFVMVSIWGLVGLLQETIGVEGTNPNTVFDLDNIRVPTE